jgi:hypothetical protein
MKKQLTVLLCIAMVMVLAVPVQTGLQQPDAERAAGQTGENMDDTGGDTSGDDGTEYWALMVAVGVYQNNPDMDRPSMLEEVARFREMLPVSDHWSEDHLRVITRENATVPNIVRGFQWLDEQEDEDDVCLVYLTTHGFPILWDLPPFDEEDGMDEALATYRGFLPFENPWSWEPLANPFAIMTDDMFNVMFNRLETGALGVIVDSCHSGGFDDNFSLARHPRSVDMATQFAGELRGGNRVVVTSVPEEDTSYGSYFAHYLIEGMQGYADSDGNGMVSLEEAFYYAEDIIEAETGMDPQMFDDYPGELLLTEVEMPPSAPEQPDGTVVGNVSTGYRYTTVASDPEGHEIRYHVDWGDGTAETTRLRPSGEPVTLEHAWNREGTYRVSVQAEDERGARSNRSPTLTVTMAAGHTVDQRQVEEWWGFLVNDTRWCAQSFTPDISSLAKVELGAMASQPDRTITVSIRETLDGPDLTSVERTISGEGWETMWTGFDLPDIEVTPGKKYYIVYGSDMPGWGTGWAVGGDDPYPAGAFYTSGDGGQTWEQRDDYSADACFVTYG